MADFITVFALAEHVDYILLLGVLTLLLGILLVIFTLYQRRYHPAHPAAAYQKPQYDVESDPPPSYSRLHSGLYCLTLEDHLIPPPPYTTVLCCLDQELPSHSLQNCDITISNVAPTAALLCQQHNSSEIPKPAVRYQQQLCDTNSSSAIPRVIL